MVPVLLSFWVPPAGGPLDRRSPPLAPAYRSAGRSRRADRPFCPGRDGPDGGRADPRTGGPPAKTGPVVFGDEGRARLTAVVVLSANRSPPSRRPRRRRLPLDWRSSDGPISPTRDINDAESAGASRPSGPDGPIAERADTLPGKGDGPTAGSTCPSLDPSKRFRLDFHRRLPPPETVGRDAPRWITAVPERFDGPTLRGNYHYHLRIHGPYRPPCRAAPDTGSRSSAMEQTAMRSQSGWSLPPRYPRTVPSSNAILH